MEGQHLDEGRLPLTLHAFEDRHEVELVPGFHDAGDGANERQQRGLAMVGGILAAQVFDEQPLAARNAVPRLSHDGIAHRVEGMGLRSRVHRGFQISIADLDTIAASGHRSFKHDPHGNVMTV